jgi:hypothetical protein
MVDTILGKTSQTPGTIARLKVSAPASASLGLGLTASENQLSDIVDIGSAAKDRAQKMRKLDAYLRIFNSALKYFNGTATRYVPQFSKVEVELIQPEKKPGVKIDA